MSQSHFYHQMKPVSSEYNTLAASTYSPDSSGPPSQPQQETATRQRGTRIVCMIARASSVIFDSIMFGTMTFVTSNLLNTQADQVGGRNIWPAEAITWPTYMFFAASLITLAIEILLFCIFWHRFSRPEQSWKLVVVEHLTQISMWAVVAFLYRYEQRSKGVWEWSCSDMAGTLRSNFNIAVNFNRLCSLQEVSWVFAIIGAVAKVVSAVVYFGLFRKTKAVESKLRLADKLGEGCSELLQTAV